MQGCVQGTTSEVSWRNLIGLTTLNKVLPKKMAASIEGYHLKLKEQFLLAEPSAILEEPFVASLKLATPPRQNLNANRTKKTIAELARKCLGGVP